MNLLYSNDAPGAYPASYYADSVGPQAERTSLEGEHNADVCIVGAGYTGLSAAYQLARRGYRVIVLEAHRVGWGASGRNGGQLGSGHRLDQMDLEARLGSTHAHALWELAQEAKATVRGYQAEFGAEFELKEGIIEANHRARYDEETKVYAAYLNEHLNYPARYLAPDELSDEVGSAAYSGGLLDPQAAHVHPLKLVLALGKGAEAAGATIHEMSEVTGIREGDPVAVTTARGRVRAAHLLLACNGYLGNLSQPVARHVMPINSFMIATEPLDEEAARSLIANDYAVADSKFVVNYFRLSSDRRMLFGGRESYGYRFSKDIKGFVRKSMLNIFPQLASARIDYGWGGTLGITMSRMPHFTRLSGNILSASGFSGHGVALSNMAGKLAAEAISGQAERFDLMADLPAKAFPGGPRMRHPLLVLAMLWFSLRDRL